MAGDYETTHKNILQSAKNLFLENGYERTNLRDICAGANVTNGAFYRHFESKQELFSVLVKPCVDQLLNMYDKGDVDCFNVAINEEDIIKSIEIGNKVIIDFIHFIYDNFDLFRLILLCSDGTPFRSFIEDLVDLEVKESIRFFDEVKKQGIEINIPEERAIHILSHCYFTLVFECVVHNYSKEEALKNVDILETFFNAGWKKILGI